jgi:hypothetical protein
VAEWARIHDVGDIVTRHGSWAVTAYGLECLTSHYPIEAARLWQGGAAYSWEDHEPSDEELAVAAQFGNTREQLIEQKALELGVPVPADVAAVLAQRRKA